MLLILLFHILSRYGIVSSIIVKRISVPRPKIKLIPWSSWSINSLHFSSPIIKLGLQISQCSFLFRMFQGDHFGARIMLKAEGFQSYCISKIADILSHFADCFDRTLFWSNIYEKIRCLFCQDKSRDGICCGMQKIMSKFFIFEV